MPEPFRFSSGHVAYTVEDLIGVCHQSPQEVIHYLKRGDFENWLAYIGETEIAKKVEGVRKLSVTEEEQLKQFIKVLQPPEPEEVTPTPSPETTLSESSPTITPSEEDTSTTEVENLEEIENTTASEETIPTTELKENTLEDPSAKQSIKTPETSEIEETKSETSETSEIEETKSEDQKAIETPAIPEVTEEPKKPIAPVNECSDEGVEPKSSFAKTVQGFMSSYISKE